jgi:uncharacterized protein (DUF983 family)
MKRKKLINIIKFISNFTILFASAIIKDKYNINFWVYLCVTVILVVAVDVLFEKHIKEKS